jgi:hypothetical protein
MSLSQKETVESLKVEWRKLWKERVDDRVRAEGIAMADYCDLFVEKGTIIHATRDFKALNFKEILEKHQITRVDRFVSPDPHIGGWNRFIKVNIRNQRSSKHRLAELNYYAKKREKQQPKKGGRGWLHK